MWTDIIPQDVFREIAQYLSFDDVKNLRLVNRQFASQLADVRFQSVVIPFDSSLFGMENEDVKTPKILDSNCLIKKYASKFRKFGISFEFDLNGLMSATTKPMDHSQDAWWGSFKWPEHCYTRYAELKLLEDLAESPLLRSTISNLANATELGLSIDSGHGWLNGMDLSDLEVWDLRCHKTDVFGPNFPAENIWHKYIQEQIFHAGQRNTIDYLLAKPISEFRRSRLLKMPIRSLESFSRQSSQPDFHPSGHTGGTLPQPEGQLLDAAPLSVSLRHRIPQEHRARYSYLFNDMGDQPPQYPLIFNGFNISAEVTCHDESIPNCVPVRDTHTFRPGFLTEAQAQWLLETYWAQKSFLASYITSIIHHRHTLRRVHSLHISKISSGLLDSLGHQEFWKALPWLHTITLLVIPDWRRSHDIGDTELNENMMIDPVEASKKLASILQRYIAPIENLSLLKVGFIGGGEHAKGICARNRHLLPAPLTVDPKAWLLSHSSYPHQSTMICLEHVQKLTIVNAWVTPAMLENYMKISRDSSLKHLTLESVSMAMPHTTMPGLAYSSPLDKKAQPRYPGSHWLTEVTPSIPEVCAWTRVIDNITPSLTFRELRVRSALTDEELHPPRDFVGNVTNLTFISCGYVRITGVYPPEYNQHLLVMPTHPSMDDALQGRRSELRIAEGMMSARDSEGRELPLLGKIVPCVSPVEKHILEQAYGFKFGWENEIKRWGAVEDGCFEGGTGRFTGTISKEEKVNSGRGL
ncbi:putative f-box domain containing protein [Phaeomoniella chlamydospora]|uniref:Putative f-box domain containing protein n=1 Tax=Phaeomoniella chlamydospora TaxID=158046 RepID=A0A0G2ENJ8_PHACM|nr:putative f-box domain containing protein [Phaeomoniella chlamydospora]